MAAATRHLRTSGFRLPTGSCRRPPAPDPGGPLHVVTVLKTGHGAFWTRPLLAELRRAGHRVTVLLPDPMSPLGRALAADGVVVLAGPAPVAGGGPVRQVLGVLALRRLLRSLAPDVVHYHLYASAVVARLASVGLPARRVHMVPGPLYLENPLIRLVERFFCRLDDLLIGTSGFTTRWYAALGMPAARLRTVPYGVDLDAFTPADAAERARARAMLEIGSGEFVAVCVALFYAPKRLVHRGAGIKGHDTLLAAWAAFRAAGGRGTLVLVGGGLGPGGPEYREQLRVASASLAGTADVIWVDTVEDVRPYYAAADVSVSPSLSENYGAAAEACALGVPTIASRVGGLPELVEGSGWLVRPGDVGDLADRLRDAAAERPRRRRERRLAARARAEELLDLERIRNAYRAAMEGTDRPTARHPLIVAMSRPVPERDVRRIRGEVR